MTEGNSIGEMFEFSRVLLILWNQIPQVLLQSDTCKSRTQKSKIFATQHLV